MNLTEKQTVLNALMPFALLGGRLGPTPAYHDLEDDVVIYKNSGKAITAGDVRRAREVATSISRASENNVHYTILSMINDLRADEGDSVEILCDNPEGPPNNAVRVSAGWTNYEFERFEGNTLEAALTAACLAKAERNGNHA